MSSKITKLGITNKKISARGGISLFLCYIQNVKLYGLISISLGSFIFLSSRGLQLEQFLKQMFAFFIDGTDMSISSFDRKKKDEGYAALLENHTSEMASSHQIKRFFIKFIFIKDSLYNKILHELFIWRLHIENPKIIILGIDTMVMDNDSSKKKEGCDSTYKKKKGFQPLHICWGTFLIDVLFRKGSSHSNHGTDYTDRVKAVVKLIRERYSVDVPIILCADSGFADQKAFHCFEDELYIHYIITSRLYKDIKQYASEAKATPYHKLTNGKNVWRYFEFADKRASWKLFRRAIFTSLSCDNQGQYLLGLDDHTDSLMYTNIGNNNIADTRLREAGGRNLFEIEAIIELSHKRGADELIHRSLKELATKEQLPFKKFGMNRAYYFLLVISHFILEAYKRDVTADVIPIGVYPNTFRRRLVDFAAMITCGGRSITLKVTREVYETFKLENLWQRCQSPPLIQFV
ncbi:MAG TPA: transposase [Bacteroidaceae bacterium]|jgi:hypothetical protein|nr:transposase [Bacteroidaceae bacterium]